MTLNPDHLRRVARVANTEHEADRPYVAGVRDALDWASGGPATEALAPLVRKAVDSARLDAQVEMPSEEIDRG